MSVLFTSCLYNLSKGKDDPRRSVATYLELCRPLLAADIRLFLFAEPDLVRPIRALPCKADVTCVPLCLEDVIDRSLRDRFASRFQRPLAITRHKDTPEYMALMHAKMDMLDAAADIVSMEKDGADVIAWIDLGVSHTARSVREEVERVDREAPSDCTVFGLAFPELPAPSPEYLLPLRQFWGRLSGGLWTFPRRDVARWRDLLIEETNRQLDADGYPFECDALFSILERAGRVPSHTGAPHVADVSLAERLPRVQIYPAGMDYVELLQAYPMGMMKR